MGFNTSIELHDSVVGSLSVDGNDLKLSLNPAYVHQSAGAPGIDPGDGLVQDALITIQNGIIEGDIGELPTHILDGECSIGSQKLINVIPLPPSEDSPVCLILNLSPDYLRIVLSGRCISIQLIGVAVWVEKF